MAATDEKTRKAVAEALFEYRRAARVAAIATDDFEQHIHNQAFTESAYTYMYHMDTARALAAMAVADGAYFNAMAADLKGIVRKYPFYSLLIGVGLIYLLSRNRHID